MPGLMRLLRSGLAGLACVALPAAGATPEDVLILKDGRLLDGLELERTDEGVRVILEAGEILVPSERVQEVLLAGTSDWQPETEEERAKFEKGLVPWEGRWISKRRRDAALERRLREVREEIDAIRDLSWGNAEEFKTKRFNFKHTLPQHVFDGYREQLEAYFDVFAKDWRVKIKKHGKNSGRLLVNFYGSREEFDRTSGAGRWTLGYFKFVGEVYDLNIYYDRNDPEGTRDVMFHEVGHYLHKLIDQGFKYPHWPGESLAEYYGAGYWDEEEEELVIGLVQEGRLAEIKSDITRGNWITLKDMVSKQGYEDYTWGWSLVHFLMNDDRYADRFKKFFLGLARARDIERVPWSYGLKTVEPEEIWRGFQDYLGLKTEEDVLALEREWHAYVDETLQLTSARGLEKAAIKSWRSEGRTIRAKRLFEEAIEAGTRNGRTYYQYGNLLYGEGDRARAIELYEQAIELAPLVPEFRYSLGYALRKKDPAQAKQQVLMAKELDPNVAGRTMIVPRS